MGKVIRTPALILLLTCSVQAGIMGNDSPAPPPPSQPATTQEGYMPNGSPTTPSVAEETHANGVMGNGAAASLAQVAWELFAVLPSLL